MSQISVVIVSKGAADDVLASLLFVFDMSLKERFTPKLNINKMLFL